MGFFSCDAVPFWTAVAALAASISAVVAIVSAYYAFKLIRTQGEPKVIVFVRHDFDRPSILTLVIENIGRDIARDVRFTLSRPIPVRAFGIDPSQAKAAAPMAEGPFVSGIPSLGPGDSRVITWGQYGGLSTAIGPEPIRVAFTYRYGRVELEGEAELEVASYAGTDASEHPVLVAAKALDRISKSMASLAVEARHLREQAAASRGADET